MWNILGERDKREYRSWRYELYSRIVGIAISHHKISLYTITGFRGGTHRQNFKKKVFNSTVKNMMQRVRTWMKRHGPSRGCHSSLSHRAGVNCSNVRFTWTENNNWYIFKTQTVNYRRPQNKKIFFHKNKEVSVYQNNQKCFKKSRHTTYKKLHQTQESVLSFSRN